MDNETDWAKDIERRRTKQNSQHRNQLEKYKDTQKLIISRKSSKKRQHIGQQTKWQRSIKKTQDRSKRLKQEEAGGETWSISILHRYKIIYQVSSVNFRGKWFQDINGVIRKRRSKKDRQYNTIQYKRPRAKGQSAMYKTPRKWDSEQDEPRPKTEDSLRLNLSLVF
jgi:hypothetical protein